VLRSLTHFWRLHLAVVLAAAVAGTVLTGSLVVGDSVEASLRALLLERLGAIDRVVVAPRLFRAALAAEVARRTGTEVVPLLLIRGSAARAEHRDLPPAKVRILGIDGRFAGLYPANTRSGFAELIGTSSGPDPGTTGGRPRLFPPLVVNETLARSLGAAPGDDLLLSCERPSAVPRETLMGFKDPESVLTTRRFTLVRVVPDRGPGSFDLAIGQATPPNAFVPLAELQKILAEEGRANTLLFAAPRPGQRQGARESLAAVAAALHASVDLADLGLTLRPSPVTPGTLVLDSPEFFLPSAAAQAALAAAGDLHAPVRRVFTYLAMGLRAHGHLLPYSLVSALDPPLSESAGSAGSAPAAPRDDEIALDAWAAEDLGASPGDRIEMSYLVPADGSAGSQLRTATAALRVRGVVPLTGLAADRSLTPVVPGMDEARDIASWEVPFKVDLRLVRPKDEDYWHRYGATPKAFLSLAAGHRLWHSPFGNLTSVRIDLAPSSGPAGSTAAATAAALRRQLLVHLPLEPFGLAPRELRAEGLRAAASGTDFTSLYLGFSSFLILSAAALTSLLFSLGLERRAREIGLLLAVGFPLRAIRRRFLAEGLTLAAAGALLGMAGACAYGALQVYGLGRWWQPAVGTSRLALALLPRTLLAGFAATVGVVFLAILSGIRQAGRLPVVQLLAGSFRSRAASGRSTARLRWVVWGSCGAVVLCGLLLAAGRFSGHPNPGLAFGLGAAALAAGTSGFALLCRTAGEGATGALRFSALALRNSTANPGRSLLALGLVASASFVLVMVAANRRQEPEAGRLGWAGFTLIGESQVPLYQDLGSPEGRAALGLADAAEAVLAKTEIAGLRELPGDDASCLNLYQPRRPRLLGIPPELARRSGFQFVATAKPAAHPLTLLEAETGDGALPAMGDEQSVRWILHLGLGGELPLGKTVASPGGPGSPSPRLRIVGLLSGSPLQGALLVSDAKLLAAFPDRGGRSVFLLRPPPGRDAEAEKALRDGLRPFGFEVTTVAQRMALYREVENTYLAIFQALGGLGLMLGTLGLAVVLLRSVAERRWELAALRAFGFRRGRLAFLLLLENGALLCVGLALGTAAGLAAAALGGGEHGPFPWLSLTATLAGVLLAGLAANLLAVLAAVRTPLVGVLKAER